MTRQRGSEVEGEAGPTSARTAGTGSRSGPPVTGERTSVPVGGQPKGAPPESGTLGLPEPLRRLLAFGLSGMFATQESLRQVVGDALPREWVDFVADQSERTRSDFLERLAGELARSLESIDLARVMQQALEGRTLEVHARIRMLPDEGDSGLRFQLSMTEDEDA